MENDFLTMLNSFDVDSLFKDCDLKEKVGEIHPTNFKKGKEKKVKFTRKNYKEFFTNNNGEHVNHKGDTVLSWIGCILGAIIAGFAFYVLTGLMFCM